MYNKKISNFIPLLSLLFLILGLIPISSAFAQTPTEQIIKNTLQPLNSEKSGLFVLQFSTTGMTECHLFGRSRRTNSKVCTGTSSLF